MYRGNLAVAVSAMGKLESVLRGMSRVPYRTAQVAAPRISGLLFEEFKQGRDPYGTPWEPISPNTYRKVTKRRWPPLTDTRRLRDGSMATAMPGGISIRMGRPEFYFHQIGTVTMPARPILPDRGWPRRWLDALNQSAASVVKQTLREGL
jgi:hypothetical protein